ncbi:MAG TPA: CD225/dispanin family protein [Cryptosporangiaceae bacterium]|nr:CD225/dispanin family protein [Cryptosporangiaceae bacterium]
MAHPGSSPQINNNLAISIVGLLLFWPVGLFALINAIKVNNLTAQGDYAGAQHAADQAKKFGKIAIIVGAGLYGLIIVFTCLSVILAAGAANTTG